MKPNICIDFDGVLNNYHGWEGEDHLSTPRKGAKEFLNTISQKYTITIFTVRDHEKVEEWLQKYNFTYNRISNVKEPAVAYIDDRAICFNGSYGYLLDVLDNFKPYWDKIKE